MRAFREGKPGAGGGAACVFQIPRMGSHWTARASAPDAVGVNATLVLIGQSGETELFAGLLEKAPQFIDLPVTLPGQKLVLRGAKPVKFALEVAWIQHRPEEEVDLCAG